MGTNEVTSTGILLDASGNVTMTESEGVVKVAYASETLTYTLLKASSASSINVPLSTESGGTAVKTIAVTVTDDAPVGSDVSATVDLSDVTDALKFELTDLATAAKYGADKAASSDPFSAQAGTGSVGTITYENGKYYYNLTADQVTALKSSAASEAATESFTYTLKDGDGTSSSVANIVISVKGSAAATVTPDFTSATQTAAVYEAALDSGSGAASGQSATASGEFVLTAAPEASSAPTVKVGSGTAEALTASAAKTITGDGFTATFTWDGSTKIAYTYTQTAKATNASNADATNAFTVAVGDKSSTLTVSVKDDKPVVTAGETTALTQTAGATTASNIATVKFGADDAASSEPVTFAVTNSESTAVTGEDLTALGISYDATDKVVTFQPTASAAAGTYSVTITAKDGDGSTTEQTVTVTVSEAAADTHAAVTAATTTPSFTIGATDPIVLGTVDFGTDGAPTEFSADSISVKVGDVAKTATWDATNSKWTVEGVGDFSVKQQSSTSVYDIQFKPSATEAAESASVTVSFKDADDTEFADGVALSYKVEAASTTSDPVITATFASNTLTLNNIAEKTASNQIVVDLGVTDADKIVNDGGADITISGDAAAAAIHSIDVSSLAAEKGVKITNANGLSWTGTDGEEAISIKADSAKSIVDVMLTDGKTDLVTSTEGLSEGGVIPVHLIGDLSTGDVVTGFVEIGSLDDTTGTFTTAAKTGSTTTTLKMTAGDTYTLSGTAAGVSFEGDAAQNISVTNTCANGNVDLGNGNDTLTLTASVDTGVSMGAGADALTIAEETNRTAKVAVYEGRAGVAATSIKTSSNGEVTQFATGDKIAFENGVDTVDGFLKANDSIGFMTNSENTTISELATLTEKTAANLSAGVYVGYGSYDSTSKTFTLADSYSNDNDDALVFHVDSANTSFTGESGVDSAVVLIGVDGTLTTDNFTVTSMSNG